MPELPEVEAARHKMRKALKGRKIARVTVFEDPIVFVGTPAEAVESALVGRRVVDVSRKGKFWWLELDEKPWLFGHFGMSGHLRMLGKDDEPPRFTKLILETNEGQRLALTDGRRLGRIWLAGGPDTEKRVRRLGFDCYDELPDAEGLYQITKKRKTPIKALLLNQAVFAGVGNYMADEALYQARIAPQRIASNLSLEEVGRLRDAVHSVTHQAVKATTSNRGLPKGWLFHKRWGKRGGEIDGRAIVHDTVGGRTTAWVPDVQK